jgi:F0F1-type ATP synthase delta subunit
VARKQLELPVKIATRVDVGRLARELADIDEALLQLRLRSGGTEVKMPKTTHLMDQLAEHNELNLLQEEDRAVLKAFLLAVKEKAPVMHVSFSADPSVVFLEKLVSWLRREIHPEVLLTVGLQPSLGAGCVLRTTNKQFDLSLREDFKKKRNLLKEKLVMPVEAKA